MKLSPLKSVRGRLLLLTIGVELVMLTLLVVNSSRLLHGAMTEQAHWQLQQITPVLDAALKAPLAQQDFSTVQAILDESRSTQGIDYLVVTDREGARVAASGWGNAPLPPPSAKMPEFSFSSALRHDEVRPIVQSGQPMGSLHLGLNLASIIAARRQLLIQGISIAAAELILSSVILLFIGLWLTRHLAALTRASLQVASGDLLPQFLSEGDDDVGQLGRAFNTMSKAIADRVGELTKAKEAAEASEREKAASEEQLRLVLDGSKDGFWDWDIASGRVTYSSAWTEMLGYTVDEIEPDYRSWERLVHPDDLPAAMELLQAHLAGQTPFYEVELRMRMKTGDWKWILTRGKVAGRNSAGEPLRATGTHTDISERKQAEAMRRLYEIELEQAKQQLTAKQQQLEALNQSLQSRVEEAVAELRQKDQVLISQSRQAAMGEMIGNIAHQWRQPLNALSMLIANVQFAYNDNNLTGKYLDDSVATANRLIQKMSTTITDFRNFFSPDKEMVDFSALEQIRHAVELVDAAYRNSNIQISVNADRDCILHGFPNEYSQVLLNLLANARDAILEGDAGGQIRITLAEQGARGEVTVLDSGRGIEESIIDKIFEPYFSTKSMGTGIGLYMSKMIIERNMHGTITARNTGAGSKFTISTPLRGQTQ